MYCICLCFQFCGSDSPNTDRYFIVFIFKIVAVIRTEPQIPME